MSGMVEAKVDALIGVVRKFADRLERAAEDLNEDLLNLEDYMEVEEDASET